MQRREEEAKWGSRVGSYYTSTRRRTDVLGTAGTATRTGNAQVVLWSTEYWSTVLHQLTTGSKHAYKMSRTPNGTILLILPAALEIAAPIGYYNDLNCVLCVHCEYIVQYSIPMRREDLLGTIV